MSSVEIGVLIAIALAAVLLVPYLFKEIRKGKVSLGPRLPDGASEPHPGRRGDRDLLAHLGAALLGGFDAA